MIPILYDDTQYHLSNAIVVVVIITTTSESSLSFINNGLKFVLQQLKRYTPMENWNRCDNAKLDQMGGSTKSDFWYTFQIVFRGHTN